MSEEAIQQPGSVDGIPAEVSEEVAAEAEAIELTLDELFNTGVEADEVSKAASEMLLPAATYTTQPPVTVKFGKDKTERPFIRFWCSIQAGDVKGKIGFGISHVRKNALDFETGVDTGKPDRSYKNYVMSVKAYKSAYGEDPPSVGAVVKYLSEYPIRLRVIQTQNAENMVVSIAAVRDQ